MIITKQNIETMIKNGFKKNDTTAASVSLIRKFLEAKHCVDVWSHASTDLVLHSFKKNLVVVKLYEHYVSAGYTTDKCDTLWGMNIHYVDFIEENEGIIFDRNVPYSERSVVVFKMD